MVQSTVYNMSRRTKFNLKNIEVSLSSEHIQESEEFPTQSYSSECMSAVASKESVINNIIYLQ